MDTLNQNESFTIVLGQLFVNRRGRFQCDNVEFHHGDRIEVLIYDGLRDSVRWVATQVLYDSDSGKYILSGLIGYRPRGLFVRYPGEGFRI